MNITSVPSKDCQACADDPLFPEAYVIHLAGGCCRCAENRLRRPCSRCQTKGDCGSLNQSVVVRRSSDHPLRYVHDFAPRDFVKERIPLHVKRVTLSLTKHRDAGETWYSACVVLTFSSDDKPVAWHCGRITDCCHIGPLRRRSTNLACDWPKAIEINGKPTPDYAPPQPEWARGIPDDLNDALFNWPALDVDRMEQSPEAFVRYFNGELQLRIKDVGSNGFGVPWGHTRIYSNRLSNNYDFGNGSNWLIHEWPQLVRRKSDVEEVKRLHPRVSDKATGCSLVLLRGTRNALWFDEFKSSAGVARWQARFGAKHVLELDSEIDRLRLFAPNGHEWTFYAFSPSCIDSPKLPPGEKPRDPRLDGKLIEHANPGGVKIVASYEEGLLRKYERSGEGVTEQFVYKYFPCDHIQHGRLEHVTWLRAGAALRRAVYTYYGKDEQYGNLGDLKTASRWLKAGTEWKQREHDIHYYRYEVQPNGTYCQGLLQSVIGPEAFHRMKLASIDPLSATTQQIKQYADIFLTYHRGDDFISRRVKTIALCGGGRKHSFTYDQVNPNQRLPMPVRPGYNVEHTLTTETRPDRTQKEVYTNFIGQSKSLATIDDFQRWTHSWEYDDNHAGLTLKAEPSAVLPGRQLKPREGKTLRLTYKTPDGFGVTAHQAYLDSVTFQEGRLGKREPHTAFGYRDVNVNYGIRAVETETRLGVAADADGNPRPGTDADAVQTYSYTFAPNRIAHLLKRTTTLPAVDNSYFANAEKYLSPNVSNTIVESFDTYGYTKESIDLRHVRTVFEMDQPKGAPRRQIVVYHQDGNARRLITNFTSDSLGRITKTLGPVHSAVVPGTATECRVRTFVQKLYKDLSGEIWTLQGFQLAASATEQYINAVQIERLDLIGRLTDVIIGTRSGNEPLTINETLPQSRWTRWRKQIFSTQGTQLTTRVYHAIPAQGDGAPTVNYVENVATSDLSKRERSIATDGGESYKTTFDGRGLPLELSVKNVAGPIVQLQYDSNQPGGNGNVTQILRNDGKHERRTSYQYDYRDRQSFVRESDGSLAKYEFTNHSAVTKITRASGAKHIATRAFRVDKRGRVCGTQLNGFTPKPSALRDYLKETAQIADDQSPEWVSGLWKALAKVIPDHFGPLEELKLYDNADQLVAIEPQGGSGEARPVTTFEYDPLGRETARRTHLELGRVPKCYAAVETSLNEIGLPILVTSRGRFPASELGSARRNAPLGDPGGNGPSGNPGYAQAQCSQAGTWYDPLGRAIATADFGTPSYFPVTERPATIPSAANIAVTQQQYDETGMLAKLSEPLGITSCFAYDHAGRTILEGSNLTHNEFSQVLRQMGRLETLPLGDVLPGLSADASLASHFYNSEGTARKSRFANLHTRTQTMHQTFGAPPAGGPAPPSTSLPSEIIDAEGRKLKLQYNRLGEVARVEDANGTVHEYEYDKAGRISHDRAVKFGANIDGSIRRIEYKYDGWSRLTEVRSFDDPLAGTMVNRVIRRYGNYNELLVEAQLHTPGEAKTGGKLNDLRFHGVTQPNSRDAAIVGHVAYFYDYPVYTVGFGVQRSNYMRLRTTWYPGDARPNFKSKRVSVRYSNSADKSFGRPSRIVDSDRFWDPAKYEYWSTGGLYSVDLINRTVVSPTVPPIVNVRLRSSLRSGQRNRAFAFSCWNKATRKRYHDWQRQRARSNILLPTSDLVVEHYDKLDMRSRTTLKKDALAGASLDESFGFDRLDRSDAYSRGALNFAETAIVTPQLIQNSRFDQSGNSQDFIHNEPGVGTFTHSRTHSRTDDILTAKINGRSVASLHYDAAGNMTQMPQPDSPYTTCKAKYDAWSRLIELDGPFGGITYQYDGLGRRMIEQQADAAPRHFYYDQDGRVLSETVIEYDAHRLDREYLWDLNRPDHLVCRIRYFPNSVERLYPLYDQHDQVQAIVDEDCEVRERFVLDPQGHVRYLNADFTKKTGQFSDYDWRHYSAELRLDASGLFFSGDAYYHADLGRALPRGPIDMLPESRLNSYVQDFPTGEWQPPHASAETLIKWYNERSPWIKAGIGAIAMLIAVAVVVVACFTPAGPLCLIGAICGGLQGGIGAALDPDSNFGDIVLGAGVGALFGAICPWGGIGSLAGSAIGITIARVKYGNDPATLATAWHWGGLVGGFVGSMPYGLRAIAPELGGGALGGGLGYYYSGGDWHTTLTGASLGMMGGAILFPKRFVAPAQFFRRGARGGLSRQFGASLYGRGGGFGGNKYTMTAVRRRWWSGSTPSRSNPIMPRGREYLELSHTYIAERGIFGRHIPDWIKNRGWNLNPMWGTEHALIDPARYRFMRRTWKATNVLNPNASSRLWRAMPRTHKIVTLSGAGFGVAGVGYVVHEVFDE